METNEILVMLLPIVDTCTSKAEQYKHCFKREWQAYLITKSPTYVFPSHTITQQWYDSRNYIILVLKNVPKQFLKTLIIIFSIWLSDQVIHFLNSSFIVVGWWLSFAKDIRAQSQQHPCQIVNPSSHRM